MPGVSVTAARIQMQSSAGLVDRLGRGRGHGLYDRESSDRKPWNSDDEDVDEFGRRKKTAKKAKTSKTNSELNDSNAAGRDSNNSYGVSASIRDTHDSVPTSFQVEESRSTRSSNTIYCMFQAKGKCHRGASCPFSHDASDFVPVQLENKIRRLCKFFEAGRCTNGASCSFAHGPDELEYLLEMRPSIQTAEPQVSMRTTPVIVPPPQPPQAKWPMQPVSVPPPLRSLPVFTALAGSFPPTPPPAAQGSLTILPGVPLAARLQQVAVGVPTLQAPLFAVQHPSQYDMF